MEIQEKLSKKRKRKILLIVIGILVILAVGGAILSIESSNSNEQSSPGGGSDSSKEKVEVTLEIRCDTVSNHMEVLEDDAIRQYIPKDGTILARTTYKGTTEDTVFDALNQLCRANNIQIEYNYTPMYQSYYVEGINYLYEFSCGPQSGWTYQVNDQFPNYGCSSYKLTDGDQITWLYTCTGLGEDVGAPAQ